MKRVKFYSLLLIGLLFLVFSSTATAQPGQSLNGEGSPSPPPQYRPNLLLELNLSNGQIQQIRRLNQERRAAMFESQRRLREAHRALDAAIYQDMENESEIDARIRDVQNAQVEVVRNRVSTERAIRKVLTPQQLSKFRELRERFSPENNVQGAFDQNRGKPQKLRNLPRDLRRRRNPPPPRQP
jgi:Spy/CpxP family protein refolding chaperone